MTEIPELTAEQFEQAISRALRRRLVRGDIQTGGDIAALRRFVHLSRPRFAEALGISEDELCDWERGRQRPQGAAIALLRIAARHPRILRENLQD